MRLSVRCGRVRAANTRPGKQARQHLRRPGPSRRARRIRRRCPSFIFSTVNSTKIATAPATGNTIERRPVKRDNKTRGQERDQERGTRRGRRTAACRPIRSCQIQLMRSAMGNATGPVPVAWPAAIDHASCTNNEWASEPITTIAASAATKPTIQRTHTDEPPRFGHLLMP